MNPIIHTAPGEHIVAMFSTHHLYEYLPAAYNSLLAYNPDVHVYLFIEHDSLPYPVPGNVTVVNISGQEFFSPDSPSFRTKYTYMVLMKTVLTKIFPDAERAVILDVDTITCASIADLWDYDLTHAYYAAVKEPKGSQLRGVPYANFGLVLLNLAKLRATGKDDLIIQELREHFFRYPEQDAFSKVCGNRFDPLDPAYNVTVPGFNITGDAKRTIVRHFAGFNADAWSQFGIVKYWLTHTAPAPRYVVYASDHRVQDMMIASAKSLLAHSQVEKIFLLVDNDDIGKNLPPVFECINVSKQDIFPPTCPNLLPWYGYMTTLRAALTKILPEYVDRVLWLDPDTVVVDDIQDIWNYDVEFHYFAAVEEVRNHNHTLKPYYNAGVMLMNLAKFRLDHMDDTVIDDINTNKHEHLEQDALNFCCHNSILPLPSRYSDSYVSEPCNAPIIKHFLARAKKDFYPAVEPFASLGWHQLKNACVSDGENCEQDARACASQDQDE